MLVQRNDVGPIVARDARIAETAQTVGNVLTGEECVVGHGAVIESSGPEVRLDTGVVVLPPGSHVGTHHHAVQAGGQALITADAAEASRLANLDGQAFDDGHTDLAAPNRRSSAILRAEASDWTDSAL